MTDPARAAQAAQALEALRERYRGTTGAVLSAFGEIAEQLAADPAAEGPLVALKRDLHRVRGTAGSFGFSDASLLCASLEGRVGLWLADPAMERDSRAEAVRQLVNDLARAFAPPLG